MKKGRLKNFQTTFPYQKFVGRILVSDKISHEAIGFENPTYIYRYFLKRLNKSIT